MGVNLLIPAGRVVKRACHWSLDRSINLLVLLGLVGFVLFQGGLVGACFWSHQPPWLTGVLLSAWALQFTLSVLVLAIVLHRQKPGNIVARFPN